MTPEALAGLKETSLQARAGVVLLRRNDLFLLSTKRATGIDLHVVIPRQDWGLRLNFGVVLGGELDELTLAEVNAYVLPTVLSFHDSRRVTYPVCLCYFSLQDGPPYYTWLAEPTLVAGARNLFYHATPRCMALTDDVVDDILGRVLAWYAATEAVPTS